MNVGSNSILSIITFINVNTPLNCTLNLSIITYKLGRNKCTTYLPNLKDFSDRKGLLKISEELTKCNKYQIRNFLILNCHRNSKISSHNCTRYFL